jgi:predicted RNA-binding Zn-ribbon protein involved in translation (DUF1610 family)
MVNVTIRERVPDDTGCEHSDLDGPVGPNGEEFHCPKCGYQIARELDGSNKPTGRTFVVKSTSQK